MTFIPTQIGAAAVFRLMGTFGAGTDFSALRAVVAGLPEDRIRAVFLDMARVTQLDCTGIGELIRLRHRVAANGRTFRMVNVPARQQHMLEMAHLSAVLGLRELGDGALTRFAFGAAKGRIGLSLHGSAAGPRRPRAVRRPRLAVG